MWFVLWFCAIGPIRKHKQRLKWSLTFNNFNTFLVAINMFKIKKKNTGTRCEICSKLTIKTPERRQFAISIFNSEPIFYLVLVLLKLTFNKQMVVRLITCWKLATLKLALLFRHFLDFLTKLMVLKLRNKSRKCIFWNFLGFFCLPHMIPLQFNAPSFTIHLTLHSFTHSNSIIWVQWLTNIWYRGHSPSRI